MRWKAVGQEWKKGKSVGRWVRGLRGGDEVNKTRCIEDKHCGGDFLTFWGGLGSAVCERRKRGQIGRRADWEEGKKKVTDFVTQTYDSGIHRWGGKHMEKGNKFVGTESDGYVEGN